MKSTNDKRDFPYINLQKSKEELNELSSLYDVTAETLLEVYNANYGYGKEFIWDILCENAPGLQKVNLRDKKTFLSLLAEIHTAETQKSEPRSDAFYLDEKGRRRVNWETLIINICTAYTFKTLEDVEQVLVYDNGLYRSAKTTVKAYLEEALGFAADRYVVSEMLGHIERKTYISRNVFNTDNRYIPLLNGLLNLESLELEEFDSEKCYTFRLPVKYEEGAGFENIEKFFSEVVRPEDVKVLQELFGYTLFPGLPAHKMVWLIGTGRNGKTTTGSLLSALVGADNTVGVPLRQLDGDHRFAVARLYGKLLNLIAEPETKSTLQTPTLKAAVGGDLLFGEKKGVQDTFFFLNFAKFVVYTNTIPAIGDESFAFWERVIAIDFPNKFTDENADKNHHQHIIEQDGLSGLLNWALIGLKRLREQNWEFSESTAQTEAKGDMRRRSQPVSTFILDWTEYNNRAEISKESLYTAYKIFCDVYGLVVPVEGEFTRDLKRSSRVRLKKIRVGGKRVWHWQGIKIKSDIVVVILRDKSEEVLDSEKLDEDPSIEDIEVHTLSDYVSGPTGPAGPTFSTLNYVGEIRIITENKEIYTTYKVNANCMDRADHLDQTNPSGVKGKQKLILRDKLIPLSPIEEGTCEQCGEERFLDHEYTHEGQKCLICHKCAEELKHEEDELSKIPAGISIGDDIEYEKIGGGEQ